MNGSSTCLRCTPGKSQFLESQKDCVPCVAGKYLPSDAPNPRTECTDCERGKKQNEPGSISCSFCAPGKYQHQSSQINCTKCGPGTARPVSDNNHTRCIECIEGRYQLDTGSSTCLGCLPGQYQDKKGQHSCTNCIEGQFQRDSGQKKCQNKSDDRVVNENRTSQSIIPEGSAIECDETSKRCTSFNTCPAGKFGIKTRQDCLNCTVGKSSSAGAYLATGCQPCESGKFAKNGTCTNCIDESYKSYSDEEGLANCKHCAPGKISIGTTCQFPPINKDLVAPKNIKTILQEKESWTSIQIFWDDNSKDVPNFHSYEGQFSSQAEFPENKRSQFKVNVPSEIITVKNTWKHVTYVRVRTIDTNNCG